MKPPVPEARWPRWVRLIANQKTPDDSGVGDTVARIIGPVGGHAYKTWFAETFGESCGCVKRQARLNALYQYTR